MANWQGKKVVVIGAARQGLAATRFLARQGAKILLTDSRPENEFEKIPAEFKKLPVDLYFGGHPLNLLDGADILCVSGGVPLTIPLIREARDRKIPITNDSQIFMESVNAKVIGITGSAGKTTTTILTGAIAKAALEPKIKVWVGGNIGYPMIDHLEEIKPEDWVVLELSSFQLDQMTISPHIAVILNITPNHLDRHKTMQAYTKTKARILKFQKKSDIAVLNRDDSGSFKLKDTVHGKLVTFGFSDFNQSDHAIFFEDGYICWYDGINKNKLVRADLLNLPGKHNLANAMAACAVGAALGFSAEAMKEGISSVQGIPHRLELIMEKNGIRWINDSIATAPERVMAAIRALKAPLVLLLGGRDKDLPWEELAYLLHEIHPKAILFGEAAGLIHKVLMQVESGEISYPVWQLDSLDSAVKRAASIVEKGEVVLLSPGGTSFDAYRDFEARGEHFRSLVEDLL